MRRKVNGHALPENRTPEGRFAPGASGNPGGRPKGHRDIRVALEASGCDQDIVHVVKRGLRHKDIRVALDAAKLAAAYLYGRPGAHEPVPTSIPTGEQQFGPDEGSVEEAERLLCGDEEPTG